MDIKPCELESQQDPDERASLENDTKECRENLCHCNQYHLDGPDMTDTENNPDDQNLTKPVSLKELCYNTLHCKESSTENSQHYGTSACKVPGLKLTELPSEVLLVLFSYLDAKFTLRVLSCVCKLFHQLLSPECIWKSRFKRLWPKRAVRGVTNYISSWKQLCVQTEDMHRFWYNSQQDLKHFELRHHFAPVDAVHVMQGGAICLSGSRDRSICVWDLEHLDHNTPEQRHTPVCMLSEHQGWIWTLASEPSGAPAFASGSWDSTVKFWDLTTQRETMTIRKEHKAAVLCMSWRPDALITGSYDKHVRIFDCRESLKALVSYRGHKRPVLGVVADDEYIITGSEDKTLLVYDRRAAAVLKKIETESPVFSLLQCKYGHRYLLAGGRAGKIYLFETIKGTFEQLETIESGHGNKVTGLCEAQGAIVTCSSDHIVKNGWVWLFHLIMGASCRSRRLWTLAASRLYTRWLVTTEKLRQCTLKAPYSAQLPATLL